MGLSKKCSSESFSWNQSAPVGDPRIAIQAGTHGTRADIPTPTRMVRLRHEFEILTTGRTPWPASNPSANLPPGNRGVISCRDQRFARQLRRLRRAERWNLRHRDRTLPTLQAPTDGPALFVSSGRRRCLP